MPSYTTTHPKLPGRAIEVEAPDLHVWRYHKSGPEAGFELDGYWPVYAWVSYHDGRAPRRLTVTDHPDLCNYDLLEENLINNP